MIFTACVACKNQVRKRQKIKFKNQFREIEILKNQVQIDKGYLGQGFSGFLIVNKIFIFTMLRLRNLKILSNDILPTRMYLIFFSDDF